MLFSSSVDTIISSSPAETQALGRELAATLQSGAVVALVGDLGAGKTHFTKGLVEAFGGKPNDVTSPTFTLVHEYREGRLPVFHFDFYRLEDVAALRHIGWEEYLLEDGVVVVEWAERFPEALPLNTVRVRFSIGAGDQRKLEVER